jgi:spore germination protein GerM
MAYIRSERAGQDFFWPAKRVPARQETNMMGVNRRRIPGWRHLFRRIAGLTLLGGVLLSMGSGVGAAEKRVLHLYFADAKRPFLVAETRARVNPDDPAGAGRQVIAELIAGPTGGGLPTLPEGTALRSFFLLDDGTAVIDFTAALHEHHPGGCRSEQLTLFSMVNSLVLNVPEIVRVQILIEGETRTSLAGHLAIDHPLTADMLLTR